MLSCSSVPLIVSFVVTASTLQTLFQHRQYAKCLDYISLNKQNPKPVGVWLIQGLSHAALQQSDKAIEVLSHGLALHPKHPELAVQLSQLQLQKEMFNDALETLNQVEIRHPQVSLLKAKVLTGLKRCSEAMESLKDAKAQGLDQLSLHMQLTSIYRQQARPDLALPELEKSLALKENDFHLKYQHACLLRELGRQEQALNEFLLLYPQGKQLPELNFVIGCTHYDLGNYEQTEDYLERCLALAPYYIPAHECLGKLRWQQGRKQEFLNSFDHTRRTHPPHPVLERSRIAQLLVAGQYEQALDSANWARHHFPKDAQFIHLTGVINKRIGQTEQSIALLQQAASLEPNNPRYQIDVANHEIQHHQYQSAQNRLLPLLNYFPDNQEIWAYLGICWRLCGDERHIWLNDYNKYIQSFELPVPANYDNREHFVEVLKQTIGQYHKPGQEQPLDQSVQGGSQSEGHLLFLQNPIIQAYRTSLEQVITQYLASLPKDDNHPLCRHNTTRFKIAGSWSVNLVNKGFHTNHIHSQGWLSGPTYLSVPPTIHKDDPNRQGWVKFGETCLELGDREEIALAVCPKAGQIVLFPSYMWHGTYPFTAQSPRMTLPCDISPLG